MKQISWQDRIPGDVGLVRGDGLLSDLIVDFVSELHEDYVEQFIPSHAFILGFDDMIIEASLTSMAAIRPCTEYENLPVQIWRIERTPDQIAKGISAYIEQYNPAGYGLLDLLGFAIEAVLQHLGNPKARNPILFGYVCSMVVLSFLRYPSSEKWPLTADLRNCDPLALLMMFQAAQVMA
jgi:hypothetical protein